MIQSTKPQSLAYGLNDSPVGLAAWILSFICTGSTGMEIEKRLSKDELLTNVMIYWVTETINSSIRLYYEIAHAPKSARQRSEVPAAAAHMPLDAPLPREWAERNVNLKHFTDMPRGSVTLPPGKSLSYMRKTWQTSSVVLGQIISIYKNKESV